MRSFSFRTASSIPALRGLSTSAKLTQEAVERVNTKNLRSSDWTQSFTEATIGVDSSLPFAASAEALRALTKTDLVKGTDLRDEPERFFEAHRILARHCVKHGPGFWIRFTVHYNLFAGTILAVVNRTSMRVFVRACVSLNKVIEIKS